MFAHDLPLLRKETLAQCPDAAPRDMLWCDTLAAVRAALPELNEGRDQRSVYAHIYGAPPLAHGTHTAAFADARANAAIAREPRRIRAFLEDGRHHKTLTFS